MRADQRMAQGPGRCRQAQRGYLFGLPLVLVAITTVLALLALRLPPPATWVLLPVGAVVWLLGLYYMVCAPGWLPGHPGPKRPRGRALMLAVMLAVAAALVAGVTALVLSGGRG